MTPKQKKMLARILVSAVLMLAAVVLAFWLPIPSIWLYLIPYFIIGWDILWKAVRNIAHGQVFDENFLMALATVGAFLIGEYAEAVFVMLFYQVGEFFQGWAVGRSRKSIAALMDIRPDSANLLRDGKEEEVDPEDVAAGSTILVKPGERVPLDGVILEGTSSLNTSALTGESLPRTVEVGDDVISGCVNLTGVLKVRTTKEYGDSTVSRILDLVENSSAKKGRREQFITRFARWYTPAVVIGAVLLAVIPPLVTGGNWSKWLEQALIFLVISCPCALVISVPLTFFGGIGAASRKGVLVKGSNYLEALAETEVVVFDKTGTLTKGVFHAAAIHPDRGSDRELLERAALAERYSEHPIAKSLKEAYGQPLDDTRVKNVEELPGRGIKADIDGGTYYVGNDKLMEDIHAPWHPCHQVGTTVHVAKKGEYLGHIVISDEVKPDAKEAVSALKAAGVKKTVMLTGDSAEVGEAVGNALGLDEVHAKLLPEDKVSRVEDLLAQTSGTLAFVGDGINDAPVLSRSDVGIAMGALGSDAAIEAADVVLMDDQPSKIAAAVKLARKTITIANQNIAFALTVKAVFLVLGLLGTANMWEATFADVGVMVLAVLNATRALNIV